MPASVKELEIAVQVLQEYAADLAADAGRGREAVASLEERVLKLELRLAEKEGKEESNAKQGEAELEYRVCESVWDSCVIVGLKEVGQAASAFLLVSSLLNLGVQGYFCYVLMGSESFSRGDHFQQMIPHMQRWRLSVAHSYRYVDTSDSSLASRVCADDKALSMAGTQTGLLEEINTYLGMEPEELRANATGTGVKLCAACIFLFAVLVLRELRRVVISVIAFAALPRSDCTRVEGSTIVAISRFRLAIVLVVSTLRALVAMALLFTGVIWLSSTSSTTDLLLNAAGLGFIMDLDEMLFEATVPMKVQRFVRDLAPLHARRRSLNLEALLPLLASIATVTVCLFVLVLPNVESMLDVKDALCGGEMDFVVSTSPIGFVQSRRTEPFDLSTGIKTTMEQKAVVELSGGGVVSNSPLFSQMHNDSAAFTADAERTMAEWAETSPCSDLDAFNGGALRLVVPSLFTTVRHLTQVNAGLSLTERPWKCADHIDYCQKVDAVRVVCPVTCGCDDPVSGLFLKGLAKGCPLSCQPVEKEKLESMECTDKDAAGTHNWSQYWRSYANYMKSIIDSSDDFDAFAARKISAGCSNTEVDNVTGTRFCDARDALLSADGVGSILGFCPATCCRGPDGPLPNGPLDCPRDCQEAAG